MQSIWLLLLLLVRLVIGESDLEALLELKKQIEKDSSGKVLVSWNPNAVSTDTCPKNWYGVSCIDGQVTSITLDGVGVVGEFDFSAIAGLKMLRNLSVSNNQLKGSITMEVGLIESLEHLDLSNNLFNGLIPSELTKLKNLVHLNLSLNNFEGIIPSGFGNFEQLKYLDLHSNGFRGEIMLLLSQLGSVEYVDLSSNEFSGSLDLGLGKPAFVSTIQHLNISYNTLDGELFSHDGMPYFDNLEVFDASNNHFVGNVPAFNFIVSLQVLRLGNNQISGSLPEALLLESSMILSELDLSHNQLEGPVGSITSDTMRNLNLSYNKLSGSLPVKVGHCAKIDLSNNVFSGNLSRIQYWGNYVEVIDLSSNLLTGTLPNQTSQFLRLTSLNISNNSLDGAVPPVLGMYPELRVIDLSLNHLSGYLLPSLFNSTRLVDLNLSFNNFTGSIPIEAISDDADFTQKWSLVSLDLSHNSFTGHLSAEIGMYHYLVYLDLSNNLFEGGIPNNLPDELRGFNVSYNNLSGVIPMNLRRFPDSAFHPGNLLLANPDVAPSANPVPSIDLRRQKPHIKATVRAAIIAALVVGTSVIVLLALIIYCRAHQHIGGRDNFKESGETKSVRQGVASHPDKSTPSKGVEPSLSSFNFHQNPLSSSVIESSDDHGETSLAVHTSSDLGLPEEIRDKEGSSSPTFISPSNLPSSKNQSTLENPGSLDVCSPDKLAGVLHLFDSSLVFSAEELSCAPAEIIARSCHGTLYKAVLSSGLVLAVKWLKEGISKGKKEFAREVKKLGNIKHPNLVSLQGYYWGPKEHEKLLISNYLNAPCLALYLHEKDPRVLPPLSLDGRLKIALDVARCLNFLHNERAIPHGNLKSTNILIETSNMNALLTDYSLHRIMTSAGTTEQVLNAGALGYRPPEFASTSRPLPSLKSDVYAFGVILLELLTGKSPAEVISGNSEVVDMTDWVRLLVLENRSIECFDRMILDAHTDEHQFKVLDSVLQVALRCILPADDRPDMRTVFQELSLIVLVQAPTR